MGNLWHYWLWSAISSCKCLSSVAFIFLIKYYFWISLDILLLFFIQMIISWSFQTLLKRKFQWISSRCFWRYRRYLINVKYRWEHFRIRLREAQNLFFKFLINRIIIVCWFVLPLIKVSGFLFLRLLK